MASAFQVGAFQAGAFQMDGSGLDTHDGAKIIETAAYIKKQKQLAKAREEADRQRFLEAQELRKEIERLYTRLTKGEPVKQEAAIVETKAAKAVDSVLDIARPQIQQMALMELAKIKRMLAVMQAVINQWWIRRFN